MATSIQQAKLAAFPVPFRSVKRRELLEFHECYEANRHRVYALAFWMTDNELTADELTRNVFLRVFAANEHARYSAETVDRALIAELRIINPLGTLTLECNPVSEILSVRRNIRRTDLERAVVELPRTERLVFLLRDVEGYEHRAIGKLLGLSLTESRYALHQARLRVRELVSRLY